MLRRHNRAQLLHYSLVLKLKHCIFPLQDLMDELSEMQLQNKKIKNRVQFLFSLIYHNDIFSQQVSERTCNHSNVA